MKRWILPALAVGGLGWLLLTDSGREVREKLSDHTEDWQDNLLHFSSRLQQKLDAVQSGLEQFQHALRQGSGS